MPRKKKEGQQITLPDSIVGLQGKLLGVKDNPDGSKSLYFGYTPLEYQDATIDYLRNASATNIFNRFNPVYQQYYEQYFTSSHAPYSYAITVPTDPHERMKLCREICILEPVIGTCVDILIDISYNSFRIENTGNEEIDNFYRDFNEAVDMPQVLEWIFQEYYYSGNVSVYKAFDGVDRVPVGYTVLNPFRVKIEGPLLFDNFVVSLDLTDELDELDKLDARQKDVILQSFPKELRQFIRKSKTGNTVLIIPRENISIITRRKQPYERYATPMLTRLIFPALWKQKLRLMDLSTAEGVINQLLVVTVGDKDRPPTDNTLKQVAQLFLTPKKSFTVFWDYTLKVNVVTPNAIETLYQDKYKEPNDDISRGLGIPRALIDGVGANYSTAFVAVQMLIERAERESAPIRRWLLSEYKKIAAAKGFSTYPKVKFDRTQLRLDTYIRMVLTPLYDRGLLSKETILLESGFDYKAELERKKKEVQDEPYFTIPTLPYTGRRPNPLDHQGREPGNPDEEYDRQNTTPTPDNGPPSTLRDPRELQTATASERDDFVDTQIQYYSTIFSEHYDSLLDNLKQVYSDADLSTEDRLKMISEVFVAFVLSSYEDTYRLIQLAGQNVYPDIDEGQLLRLKTWHMSSLQKFSDDLYSSVKSFVQDDLGRDFEDYVDDLFERNRYRVNLFATEGILEGVRLGEVASLKAKGVVEVRWQAVMDDKTCSTCADRHGRVYPISAVPSRPHIACRCWLEPVTLLS